VRNGTMLVVLLGMIGPSGLTTALVLSSGGVETRC